MKGGPRFEIDGLRSTEGVGLAASKSRPLREGGYRRNGYRILPEDSSQVVGLWRK